MYWQPFQRVQQRGHQVVLAAPLAARHQHSRLEHAHICTHKLAQTNRTCWTSQHMLKPCELGVQQ